MLSKRLTLRTSTLALLALALNGPSCAAELGEVKVNSHIGQQLSADIELVDLTAADLAELQARMANPDVFKGAGLEVPPVLGGLNIAVARRDNKRFLHLTTLQPVNADVLHIFLELSSAGRQTIRVASLWLTPEPPAQRAARIAAAQPAAALPPAPVAPVAVATEASPASIPAAAKPSAPQSAEAAMKEAAQRAFAYRRQKAQEAAQADGAGPAETPVAAPAKPAATPKTSAPASPATASPVAAVARHAPAPAQACAPEKQVEAQLQQCQAMTSKLADIEGKVQRLQSAMAAPAVVAPAPKTEPAASKPGTASAKPASAPVKPGATQVKPGVAADLAVDSRKRLITIVGGVLAGLAALGGMIFFMRKRQAKGPLKIWQSFRKKGATEVEDAVVEGVEQVAAQ